jgi:mRNA-degrading endonuclease HigB of HigAB toxin-antitoxin module
MRVLGTSVVYAASKAYPAAASELNVWVNVARGAYWHGSAGVRATFSTAVHVGGLKWEFPMPTSGRVVQASIQFPTKVIVVTAVV